MEKEQKLLHQQKEIFGFRFIFELLQFDKKKQIKSLDVNFGNIKRQFTCLAIDPTDTYCYCGTTSGDVFEVINTKRFLWFLRLCFLTLIFYVLISSTLD